jgi:hypothetical protein
MSESEVASERHAPRPGSLELPPVTFAFFNPETRSYSRTTVGPMKVRVSESLGAGKATESVAEAEGVVIGDSMTALGGDLVVAFNLSHSMGAMDFAPNQRIWLARKFVRSLIDRRSADRIGLVLYGGEAYAATRLAGGHPRLLKALASATQGQLGDGRAIGDALASALNCLCEVDASPVDADLAALLQRCRSSGRPKTVLLITDGESNGGRLSPWDAALLARQLHVRVVTVMIGKGGAVPVVVGYGAFGHLTTQTVEVRAEPGFEHHSRTSAKRRSSSAPKSSLRPSFAAEIAGLESPHRNRAICLGSASALGCLPLRSSSFDTSSPAGSGARGGDPGSPCALRVWHQLQWPQSPGRSSPKWRTS